MVTFCLLTPIPSALLFTRFTEIRVLAVLAVGPSGHLSGVGHSSLGSFLIEGTIDPTGFLSFGFSYRECGGLPPLLLGMGQKNDWHHQGNFSPYGIAGIWEKSSILQNQHAASKNGVWILFPRFS